MNTTYFKNLPIKRKLILLMIFITGGALLLFTLLFGVLQVGAHRQAVLDNTTILAKSMAELSIPALTSADKQSAEEILSSLRVDPDIELAVIFSADESPFAIYRRSLYGVKPVIPVDIVPNLHRFIFKDNAYKLEIFCPIMLEGKYNGTIYILSSTGRMTAHLQYSALLLALSLLLVLAGTVQVSRKLQHLITRPVFYLARTAKKISEQRDYSIRVKKTANDEVGRLVDDFNVMLEAVQTRDNELNEHRQNLEVLVRDRTEELRAKRDEALEAVRAKSEFLANMSHEIRTPMNGVIGVLSLLKEAPMTEEYRRLLDTATRSADSLLLIINDILDFSKIDAGKISFESIIFDLRELMEETSELFIDSVNLKGLDLTCYIPTDMPCRIKGDPTRLRQVLTNLLSNAVKFTEAGEVKLQVSQMNRNGMGQVLYFSVEDTGIGIDDKALENLFEKFTQADGSTTRKYGGTGLGLSVCKQLVEMQGGEIGVTSSVGRSTSFWFTLPFEIVEDSCPIMPCGMLKGKRYLHIDDNQSCRMIVERYLELCGAEVISCGDPEGGLALLAEMHDTGRMVDTILLDYQMPVLDGLRLATLIKNEYNVSTPEMVLFSSEALSRAEIAAAGIRSMLLKPVRQLDLYNSLANVPVRPKRQVRQSSRQSFGERLEGTVLLVDDEPINQKIAVAILQKFGLSTEVAATGLEAVEMTAETHFSIVLMDIQMPEMSGYEATELIRQREQSDGREKTTIIAMTANALESTRMRCLALGMDDFISKPIKPDDLADRLRPWLRDGKDAADTLEGDDEDQNAGTADLVPIWDLARAMQFVGDDQGLLKEMVDLFLKRNDMLLAGIKSAVLAGDAKAIRDAAHAYKGAVNHFAAERLRQLAFSLEMMGKSEKLSASASAFKKLEAAAEEFVVELSKFRG